MEILKARQGKVNLIRSLYVKSHSIASTSSTTFWWALQTQTVWVIFEPARKHHLGFKAQNFENPILTFGCFSLKAVYNSWNYKGFCKLQSFCLCTPLLLYFSDTYLLNLSSSYTFVTSWSASVAIVFPFFKSRFCNYSIYIFDFMWSSSKVFKDIKIFSAVHLRPFIRYQGKKLDLFWIWCLFQSFLHCLIQPSQVIYSPFHIIFIISTRLWILQPVNLRFVCFWNIAL